MMDRIDLQIDVPPVSAADLALPAPAEGSADVAARVAAAHAAQTDRAVEGDGGYTNAEISTAAVERVAAPAARKIAACIPSKANRKTIIPHDAAL